ncbi:MAG: hypothetical protein H3Z52_01410 [archaeon]|nr:hypothetical protein [archaeon]MCP8319588.1 hypothetical protein [archaeon]
MSERRLAQSDISVLFHSVLFAYQMALRNNLGEIPSAVITIRVVPIIEGIIEKDFPELANAKNTDDALKKFADLLRASGFVLRANIEKDGERYILDINGCVFAGHVHKMLKLKDVTCPWAIFAMSIIQKKSILQKISNRGVKMNLSEFNPSGSKTLIEFL